MKRFVLACCLISACGATKPKPAPESAKKSAEESRKEPAPGKCHQVLQDGTRVEVKCK